MATWAPNQNNAAILRFRPLLVLRTRSFGSAPVWSTAFRRKETSLNIPPEGGTPKQKLGHYPKLCLIDAEPALKARNDESASRVIYFAPLALQRFDHVASAVDPCCYMSRFRRSGNLTRTGPLQLADHYQLRRHQFPNCLRLFAEPLRVLGGAVENRRSLEGLELTPGRNRASLSQ